MEGWLKWHVTVLSDSGGYLRTLEKGSLLFFSQNDILEKYLAI